MIIEKTENGIYKMLDLSELPKKKMGGKEVVDWVSMNNHPVRFQWGEKSGVFHIVRSLPKKKAVYSYNKKEMILSRDNLKQFSLNKLLSDWGEYIYEVGEVVNENILIKEKTKKVNKKGLYYRVQCTISKNEWLTTQDNLKKGRSSPYKNWLFKEKHILSYLESPDVAKKISSGSNKTIETTCPYCDRKKEMEISALVKHGFNCNYCSDKTSFPEKVVQSYLEEMGIEYEFQKKFEDIEGYIYDFYLPKNQTIIEVHGLQHYQGGTGFYEGKFEKIKRVDTIKKEAVLKKGLHHIIIDARKSEYEHIFNSINSSVLPKLKSDDITKLKYRVENSFKLPTTQIIQNFKNGWTYKELSEEYGLSKMKLIGILKRNGEYKVRNQEFKGKRSVVCVNTGQRFDSINSAARHYNMKSGVGIGRVCKKIDAYSGRSPLSQEKLKWMFAEEYDNSTSEELRVFLRDSKTKINYNAKRVVCFSTKILFNSVSQASKIYKVDRRKLTKCCDREVQSATAGKHPTTGEPLKWMYYEDYVEKYGTEGLTEYAEDKRELL